MRRKEKLLLENLAKAPSRYFSGHSVTLSIVLLHCSCLYLLVFPVLCAFVRASSILEDFNWAATLVLHVHKIVGMALKAQQLRLRNEILVHKTFWPKYLQNGEWEQFHILHTDGTKRE